MDARRAKLEAMIIIAAESLGVPWHISQYCANTAAYQHKDIGTTPHATTPSSCLNVKALTWFDLHCHHINLVFLEDWKS